ncbi:MAG: DUF4332 domain-containing protein, partial [Gemmatimonadetes bacterium]|nr:DUF4332 domain-containing protein [Gemmatimonadota bacterium]
IVYRLLVWHRLAPAFGAYRKQKPQPTSTTIRAGLIIAALLSALSVDYYMERWTITSVTPRVERIEFLDKATLAMLHRHDIHHLTQLEGWQAYTLWPVLQKELNAQQYADLQRIAALYLHQGIGVDYGNWLIQSDIASLSKLAALSPVQILEKMANAKPGEPLPPQAKVHVWIRRADHSP